MWAFFLFNKRSFYESNYNRGISIICHHLSSDDDFSEENIAAAGITRRFENDVFEDDEDDENKITTGVVDGDYE